jgi:glycosyltransferase involved in cell wall biosynthesis
VFLFPSIHEGFPKVVVEAMACGLPALVFDAYGPEAVFDGQTGFVVRTDAEMERRLREVLQDDGLRTRLGHGAAQRALDFSWDKIVKNYERVILESCRPQGLVTATAR